jgi:phage shock protein PspC (stress-responsive transcriptional regulator)
MNKTININLGGIFFHIDELAYEKLKRYLDAVRRSLSDDPQGRDEILNDIELRIGELLAERIKNERQVINETDIDEITTIMGKPEDYSVDEELFNDEPKYQSKSSSKKLFRDGDDKFLGGVSSGLSHYFGIADPLWIRLAWIVLVVAGFGTGIPIYILLWILIPEAQTTAEKLQMKGEPVNISNIEKKIREELEGVSSRVKDGVNDVTNKMKSSDFQNKTKSGIQEIVDALTKILITLFKVFGKFIGALLVFIAAATLIGLIIGAFSWGSIELFGFGNDFVQYPSFFYDSVIPGWLLIIFGFLALAIPFIVLFMLGLRILSSNVKSFSTATKLTFLGIWIIAILGLGFAAINFAAQTAYNGVSNTTEELPIIANDTIFVNMLWNDDLSKYQEIRRRYSTETVLDNSVQKLFSSRINLDIKNTNQSNAYIKIRKESEGKSKPIANNNAEAIEYQFNLSDKNLDLNGYFLSDIKNMAKDQILYITIYLPVNAVIYLDTSTATFLDDIDNIQNIYDRNMPKNYFKMTDAGLECLDCDASIFGESYKKQNEKFNLNIDSNGVEININDGKNNAEVKIDDKGVRIN